LIAFLNNSRMIESSPGALFITLKALKYCHEFIDSDGFCHIQRCHFHKLSYLRPKSLKFSQVLCCMTSLHYLSSQCLIFFIYNFVSLWLESCYKVLQMQYKFFPTFPLFFAEFTFGRCPLSMILYFIF